MHKLGKYTMKKVRITELKVNEITYCRQSGRYRGVSIGRDRNGYFVTTHRARSHSFSSPGTIPASKIKWIRSTG